MYRFSAIFLIPLMLAGCYTVPAYEFNPDDNYAVLEVVGENISEKGLIAMNSVQIQVLECAFKDIGEIDLVEKASQEIRISTERPFYADVRVTQNEFFSRHQSGSMYIAFQPVEEKRYRLKYTEHPDRFSVELYSFLQGRVEPQKERLYKGYKYISDCPEG